MVAGAVVAGAPVVPVVAVVALTPVPVVGVGRLVEVAAPLSAHEAAKSPTASTAATSP